MLHIYFQPHFIGILKLLSPPAFEIYPLKAQFLLPPALATYPTYLGARRLTSVGNE